VFLIELFITFIIINYLQGKYTLNFYGSQIFRARKTKAPLGGQAFYVVLCRPRSDFGTTQHRDGEYTTIICGNQIFSKKKA